MYSVSRDKIMSFAIKTILSALWEYLWEYQTGSEQNKFQTKNLF